MLRRGLPLGEHGQLALARLHGLRIHRVHVVSGDAQPLAAVLTNTTASFTTADETKLDAIEALADVTEPFAAMRMNKGISQALAGKSIESI